MKIDGHDVRDVTIESLRHHVGVVLDEPFLFSASIRDNIAYGRPGRAARGDCRRRATPPVPMSFIGQLAQGYRHRRW